MIRSAGVAAAAELPIVTSAPAGAGAPSAPDVVGAGSSTVVEVAVGVVEEEEEVVEEVGVVGGGGGGGGGGGRLQRGGGCADLGSARREGESEGHAGGSEADAACRLPEAGHRARSELLSCEGAGGSRDIVRL